MRLDASDRWPCTVSLGAAEACQSVQYPESKLNEADLASLENTGSLPGAQLTPKNVTTPPAGDWPSCEYWT